MRVLEIITESRSSVNEGLGASIFDVIFGRLGLALAERELAKAAAERLAEKWAAEIIRAERAGVKPVYGNPRDFLRKEGLQPKTIDKIVGDRDLLKQVLSRAKTLAKEQKLAANLKVFATGWDITYGALTAWGVGKPIYDCMQSVAEIYNGYQNKDPRWPDEATMSNSIRAVVRDTVREVASILLGSMAIKTVFGTPGWINSKFFNGFFSAGRLGTFWNGMGKAAQMAWVAWLVTPQGTEWFAQWLVGEGLLQSGFKYITDKIAEPLITIGLDKLQSAVDPRHTPGSINKFADDDKEPLPTNPVIRRDPVTGRPL